MPQSSLVAPPVDRAAVADALGRLVVWARRAAPSRMSSTSVTTLVNRLCQEGYAERLPHPHDGRSMLVGVTAEGRRVLHERHAERTAALERAISGLSPAHQSALGLLVEPLRALTEQTPNHESSHA
jgi:hypothetical protein